MLKFPCYHLLGAIGRINILSASVILLFLLLPGCVYQQKRTSPVHLQVLKEISARYPDIPIPFNAQMIKKRVPTEVEDDALARKTVCLQLETSELYADLISFYRQEMDQNGWRLVSSAQGGEAFYYYQKPTRWASVVIRDTDAVRSVTVFIGSLE